MIRQCFTEEQINLLHPKPYVYSVTGSRLSIPKTFKEEFITAYNKGHVPRDIFEAHGFDLSPLGNRRIWSNPDHIRAEYKKYVNSTRVIVKGIGLHLYNGVN
ncbi:MAG: hypothetical protein Q4E99_02220 [Bacillota bacterium]|nr:hypothetical protein [Bacillota bacterium]